MPREAGRVGLSPRSIQRLSRLVSPSLVKNRIRSTRSLAGEAIDLRSEVLKNLDLTIIILWPLIFATANGATGVSDMSDKASRVEVEQCGQKLRYNRAVGTSEMDGQVCGG